jgi:hypothetical protein
MCALFRDRMAENKNGVIAAKNLRRIKGTALRQGTLALPLTVGLPAAPVLSLR